MPGVTLSRWTMSYFAIALACLLGAEVLMAAGFGFPAASVEAPQTLVLVHVVAIGWLSLLMCGALFQFVPVLVARPIYSNTLPLPALVLLLAGLGVLLLGFLQLAGTVTLPVNLLPFGGTLLVLGFTLVIVNLGLTLWAARPLVLPARFVAAGLWSLAATVALGFVFSLVLGGVTSRMPFPELTASGLPLHAIAGLGGWLTFSAMGVSYRLLAMFMLAPELDGATARGAFRLGVAALAVAIAGGIAAICLGTGLAATLAAATLLGLAALALYARDIVTLYRKRKRRTIELNSRMAGVALLHLATAVLFGAILLATGTFRLHVGAWTFLVAFGWLSGLGLAKLYKIVAFLTWLECYGPVLGRTPTPRVQDLVVEPRAMRWFALYFAAVWVSTASLLLAQPVFFRGGAAAMMIATAGIALHLLRTRRLSDVKPQLRLPQGARQPRLFISTPQHA